jgi:hypothetical protein
MKSSIINSTLGENTKKAYISILNGIEKVCNTNIETVIGNPDEYYPKIISKCKEDSSCRNNIKVLLSLMNHSGFKGTSRETYNIWYKHFLNVSKKVTEASDNNVQTEKSLNWEDVLKLMDNMYSANDNNTLFFKVVLGIYTLIPPRRQKDYWKICIIEKDDKQCDKSKCTGFLHQSGLLEIHDYKTADDSKGPWKKELPSKLHDIIRQYIANRQVNSQYLFCKRNGEPFKTLYSFTDANNAVLKNIFKNNNISVNSLRHAAATWANNNSTMTRAEKKQFADDMGHSFSMQQQYVEAVIKKPN